jgi:hypothetical protein
MDGRYDRQNEDDESESTKSFALHRKMSEAHISHANAWRAKRMDIGRGREFAYPELNAKT